MTRWDGETAFVWVPPGLSPSSCHADYACLRRPRAFTHEGARCSLLPRLSLLLFPCSGRFFPLLDSLFRFPSFCLKRLEKLCSQRKNKPKCGRFSELTGKPPATIVAYDALSPCERRMPSTPATSSLFLGG